MRYSFTFLFVLLLCLFNTARCQNKPELIKKLHIKKSTLTKPSHPNASKEEIYFDTDGNDSLKLQDGEKDRTWEYSYDRQNRMLQCKEFTSEGKLWIEDNYTYNTDGSFKKENKWFVGMTTLTHYYFYNSNGEKTKVSMSDGTVFEYQYDIQGNAISYTRTEGTKKETVNTVNRYNTQKQLIEKLSSNKTKTVNIFDDRGLITGQTFYDEVYSPGKPIICKYVYE